MAVTTRERDAFETMAQSGSGDAGGLAVGLRNGVTGIGLRALAAKALHVAAAAPDRLSDVYENAAAGWLSGPVFTPKLRTDEPLRISRRFWTAFWALVDMPADARDKVFAQRTLLLAGELDPRISARMAAAAMEYPGVEEAASGGIPEPYGLEGLATLSPASLGYLFHEETVRNGGRANLFNSVVPLLRHMPPPLDYINIQVIQSLTLLSLVTGYSAASLDLLGLGGFLMAQTAHQYSALSTAVSLTIISIERPDHVELMLDCIFKGWTHGRETPPLIGVPWETLWHQRLDQIRQTLGVTPFASPYPQLARQLNGGKLH